MTKVECQACGYTWDYGGSGSPRCTQDGCRSRDVEPVEPQGGDAEEPGDGGETPGGDTQDSGDTDSGGRTPLWELEQTRTDAGSGDRPAKPQLGDDGDDTDGDDDGESSGPDVEVPELEPEDVRPFLAMAIGGPPEEGDDPVPGYASQQRGDHWALREHEMNQLSRAYARVGNKYLPYLLAEYTVEGMALLATLTVMGPRIQEDRRRAKLREKAEADDPTDAAEIRSDHTGDGSEESDELDVGGLDVDEETDEGTLDGDAWSAGASV